MWRSALQIFLASTLLTACKARQRFEDKSHQLELSAPISGRILDQESTTAWSLFNIRRFNITACLNESALQRPVGIRDWIVQGQGVDTQARSTSQGCVTWIEKIEFEPSAQPAYIPLHRILRSKDGAFRSLAINFTVNPWSGLNGTEAAVLDPQFEDSRFIVKESDSSARLAGLDHLGTFSISNIAHRLAAQPDLALELHFKPELHSLTMSGAETILPIESGRFDLTVQIAYRSNSGAALEPLTSELAFSNRNFENGVVDLKNLNIPKLKATDRSRGSYHLLLRLTPLNASPGLKAFSGVIDLGDWAQLRGGTSSNADQSLPAEIRPLETRPQGDNRGFSLGMVQGATYGPADENSVYRRIQLSMHVPVYGAGLGDSLEGEEFSISFVEHPEQNIRVKVIEGSLSWQDSVVHNYYAPMTTPLERDLTFTRVRTGEKIKKTLDLTPWLRFLLVMVDGDSHNANVTGSAAPLNDPTTDRRPQVRLESPCMSPGDMRYSVDPATLNLKIGLQPFFQFSPTVRRFDELFWGMATFDGPGLRAGYYLLTLAVFNLDQPDLTKPIAITQKIVLHLGGALSTQMSLNTGDLSLTRLRNYVVAQINFLDPTSLRDDRGAPIDGLVALRDRKPVATGRVMEASELNVNFPINIFPLVLANDSCAANTPPENVSNPEITRVTDQLRTRSIDLLTIYKNTQAQPLGTPDRNGWKGAARDWGLEGVELASPADTKKLGFTEDQPLANIATGLECAYQAGEQDPKMPAKCTYDRHNPLWDLCQAIAVKWYDMLDKSQTARLGTSRMRAEQWIAPAFYANCTNETAKYMRVRKYVHVLELEDPGHAEVLGGSVPVTVGLKSAFTIGTDDGTEFMHEDLTRLALSIDAFGKIPNGPVGTQRIIVANPTGPLSPPTTPEAALVNEVNRMGLKPNVTVRIRTRPMLKARDSMRWVFNYQIPFSYGQLSSSTSLNLERLEVNLKTKSTRTCYTIEPSVSEEQWEGLLLPIPYAEAPAPRFYVCFPEVHEASNFVEHYFFISNNPGAQGAMIDSERAQNRWMLTFRGQRDFGVFMLNLRPHIQGLFRDEREAVVPIDATMASVRESHLLDKTMYPGAIAAPSPSADNYESIYSQEGYLPKILRWISQTINPFEDNGAPTMRDQNSPDTRVFRGN